MFPLGKTQKNTGLLVLSDLDDQATESVIIEVYAKVAPRRFDEINFSAYIV